VLGEVNPGKPGSLVDVAKREPKPMRDARRIEPQGKNQIASSMRTAEDGPRAAWPTRFRSSWLGT